MNEKKVTVITIVCLIFIILAGGGAIYYLQFEVLAVKEEELAQLKERVRVDTDKKNKIPELDRRIKEVGDKLKDEQTKIPDLSRAEYDELAVKLDSFRTRAGVVVERGTWASPKQPIPMPGRPGRLAQVPPTFHKVEYDLAVTGSFFQLLRYINLLEQERRFINVESFSISPGSQAPPAAAPGTQGVQPRALAPRRDLKITVYSYTSRPKPVPFEISAPEERPSLTTELPPD